MITKSPSTGENTSLKTKTDKTREKIPGTVLKRKYRKKVFKEYHHIGMELSDRKTDIISFITKEKGQ